MQYIIKHYKRIDSTNKEVERILQIGKEPIVVVADGQSKGEGRFGRKWESNVGKGLYMSLGFKSTKSPEELSRISLLSPSAVSKALNKLGVKTKIKWPNDIILNEKKLGGISTKIKINETYNDIIIGIGININHRKNDFSKELEYKATSIKIEQDQSLNQNILLEEILREFNYFYREFDNKGTINKALDYHKKNSVIMGKEVYLYRNNSREKVLVKDIGLDGSLIVFKGDRKIPLKSGEVSIRGLDSYI